MELTIKNLHKSFGQHVIFDSLSLTIPSQKLTVLYGPSGCGKTTLLNMIGLIEPYQSGQIHYDGKVIKSGRDKRKMLRNDIGFIFQDFGLIENDSIINNMDMVYRIRKMKNKNQCIKESLNQVQLDIDLNRKVYELSGGEQQRVAIAKILLKNPKLILADEPTASLDEENKNRILSLLKNMVNEGKTVVIVSHDPYVRSLGDEVIELQTVSQ